MNGGAKDYNDCQLDDFYNSDASHSNVTDSKHTVKVDNLTPSNQYVRADDCQNDEQGVNVLEPRHFSYTALNLEDLSLRKQ